MFQKKAGLLLKAMQRNSEAAKSNQAMRVLREGFQCLGIRSDDEKVLLNDLRENRSRKRQKNWPEVSGGSAQTPPQDVRHVRVE